MTIQEFYENINGNYADIISRLITEERIKRFLLKFLTNEDFSELKKAWENQNAENIFGFSHRLKGISLNLSFTNFATYTSELTELYRQGETSEKDKAQETFIKIEEEYKLLIKNIKKLEQ